MLATPIGDAFEINPKVSIKRGTEVPFVSMDQLEPGVRDVKAAETRSFSSGSKFEPGDALMARITPCLENGKIARYLPKGKPKPAAGSTEFMVLRGRPGITMTEFAYYFAIDPTIHDLAVSLMTGTSGRQRVDVRAFSETEVRIPNLETQRAISSVLGSLDDKIAANNSAVESAERLIDTVICKRASTTKAVTIANELVLHYGKSLPASKRVPGGIPVVGSGGVGGWHSSSLVEKPTIVVGRKGTIGALHWIDGPSFPIDTTFWVESKRLPIRFIYSLLKLVDFSGANTDSAVPGLNRSVAYEKSLPFISDEAVSELLPEVSTLDALCSQLRRETQSLANTRDELLPLLMSGKITVKEAGQEAVAAGAHTPSQEGEA